MNIVGLNQVPSNSAQVDNTQNSAMGKDDFLKLLVVQLQAQDPLNPMDATGFTAQLAQFSSLEQLQNVNSALGDLTTAQSIMTNAQAIGFIGKNVLALGNAISVASGQSTPLEIDLGSTAAQVNIGIYDANGGFVRNLAVENLSAGHHNIAWDATTLQGNQAADGNYTFTVNAVDAQGAAIETISYTSGTVTGVNFKNGLSYLLTETQEIPMGDVVTVLSNNDDSQ